MECATSDGRQGGCLRRQIGPRGCKIHFPFLSLSNGRAEVTVGEGGAFVKKPRE